MTLKEIDWAALLENGGVEQPQTIETVQFDEFTDTDLDQSISISNTTISSRKKQGNSRPGSSRSQDTISPLNANLRSFQDLSDSESEVRPVLSPALKKSGSLTRKKSNVSFSEPEVEYEYDDLEDELENMRIFSVVDLDKSEIEEHVEQSESVDESEVNQNVFSIGDLDSSDNIKTEEIEYPDSPMWKEVVNDKVMARQSTIPVFMVPKPKKVYKDEDTLTQGKSTSSVKIAPRKRSKSDQSDSTIKSSRSSSRTGQSRRTSKAENYSYSSFNTSKSHTMRKSSTSQDETNISYSESFTSDVTISAVSEQKKSKSKRLAETRKQHSMKTVQSHEQHSMKKVQPPEQHSMKTVQPPTPPVCQCQRPRIDINLTDYPLPLAGLTLDQSTLDELIKVNPGKVAVHNLMKAQLSLTQGLLNITEQLLSNELEHTVPNAKYTTYSDTMNYIRKNQPYKKSKKKH